MKKVHPDCEYIMSPEFRGCQDEDMEKNIGKRGRFLDPKYPAYQGEFEIVGLQTMWGHNEEGKYIPDLKGYRVVMDSDAHRFGTPANLKEIEIFEG